MWLEGEVRGHGRVRCPAVEDARGGEYAAEEALARGDARRRGAEGSAGKKMVGPAACREACEHLGTVYGMSERRACRVIGGGRASMRDPSRRAPGEGRGEPARPPGRGR